MNIFVLHQNPKLAAQMQCDKHVVKMILESAQMLSAAHRTLDGDTYADANGLYKTTHKNHPCTKWVQESIFNYRWLYVHFIALGEEYTYRYGKEHLSITKLKDPLEKIPDNIPVKRLTPFAQATGDIKEDTVVNTYREYYMHKQNKFNMAWTNRDMPNWFNARSS